MRASAVATWLLAVACNGADDGSAVLVLEGPQRLAVDRLGPVDGPVAVLDDGTTPDGLATTADPAEVAAVDGGVVHAVGPGEATIVHEWEGQRVSWVLVVSTPVSLRFVDPPARVGVGESVTLDVAVDGSAADLAWSSSDPSVARVDPTGTVTGVADGVAYITASAGRASAMVEIAVTAPD